MFRKYFSIQLDNPCGENWENMIPDEGGRFCKSCTKHVIDFTEMSDAEIVAYFRKYKNICGRFNEEQLDRNLLPYTRKQTLFGKAIAAVMLLFQTFISEAQTPNVKPKAVIEQSAQNNLNYGSECSKMIPGDSGFFIIKILVTDTATNQPIHNARVIINGDTVECLTNSDGWIEIELPNAFKDSSVQLSIIKKGYKPYQHETILDTKIFAVSLVKIVCRALYLGGATYRKVSPKQTTNELYRIFPGLFRDF